MAESLYDPRRLEKMPDANMAIQAMTNFKMRGLPDNEWDKQKLFLRVPMPYLEPSPDVTHHISKLNPRPPQGPAPQNWIATLVDLLMRRRIQGGRGFDPDAP